MTYAAALETCRELIDYGVASLAASTVNLASTQRQVDAADYDGNPLFYFEVVATNAHADTDYDVTLYDVTNATARVTVTVPHGSANARLRSAAFSPASGAVVYSVLVPQTAANNNVLVFSGRIVIVQDSTATKTVISYPWGGPLVSSTSSAATSWDYGFGLAYAQTSAVSHSRWLKTASAWATVSGCALDVVISVDAATGSYAIVDVDDSNTEVTGAVVTTTSTSAIHKYATFDWSALTDGHQFEVMGKSSGAGNYCKVYGAELLIKLSSLQAGEVYRRIGITRVGTYGHVQQDFSRQKYTAALFTSPTVYFEATGFCADNGNRTLAYQVNSDTSISGGAAVTGAAINWNSDTRARQRTSAITPTTNYNLYGDTAASTASQSVTGMLLVIAFAGVLLESGFLPRSLLLGVG